MTDEDLETALAALRKTVRKRTTSIERGRKALDELSARGALGRLATLEKSVSGVRDADLELLGLGEEQAQVVAALEQRFSAARSQMRGRILAELRHAGEAAGVLPELLTERPLVVLLAPLTVELDLTRSVACIQYARETISEVDLDARKVLAAREAATDHIREHALESAQFFELARQAYEVARRARGLEAGARVDLVDLLAPLGLLRVAASSWRKQKEGAPPFPRYLLAYQLRRLGRDRLLQHEGVRLELGTATGGSTRNKRDVLFVPTSPTEGQYHLSIRFTEATS